MGSCEGDKNQDMNSKDDSPQAYAYNRDSCDREIVYYQRKGVQYEMVADTSLKDYSSCNLACNYRGESSYNLKNAACWVAEWRSYLVAYWREDLMEASSYLNLEDSWEQGLFPRFDFQGLDFLFDFSDLKKLFFIDNCIEQHMQQIVHGHFEWVSLIGNFQFHA